MALGCGERNAGTLLGVVHDSTKQHIPICVVGQHHSNTYANANIVAPL